MLIPEMELTKIINRVLALQGEKRRGPSRRAVYYETLLRSEASPSYYIPFYVSINKTRQFRQTSAEFKLRDYFSFGESAERICETLGQPDFRIQSTNNIHSEVILYRLLWAGYKTRCQLHFLDQELYYYKLQFRYLTSDDRKNIINAIEFKYLNGEEIADETEIVIKDHKGNALLVEDKADLTLHYISGDDVQQHLIEQELDLKIAHSQFQHTQALIQLIKIL